MPANALPALACDCHVHVIDPRHPMVPERAYTPGPAAVQDLRAHLARLGLARAVIVQPSVYGTDNQCLLESLAALPGAARGVAVADPQAGQAELRRLHLGGVRGLRINLESLGRSDPQAIAGALRQWAGRIAGLGWHLQVYASLDAIAQAAPLLAGLPVPIVLDHFAMIPAGTPLQDARVERVLEMAASGMAYVKLSASYRIAGGGQAQDQDQEQVAALARALLQANPARMLWASDWPHTNREPGKRPTEVSAYRRIAPSHLLREIHAWLPDAGLRRQVLADNPARLYDFG
ncbi:amidohydrolase family protein [Orrella sp. JC864]|uniref:amidohydrolase family protein n=1 Tax=Orrella sp. JC864 TaxID=3120298 RepID=UPI00300B0394